MKKRSIIFLLLLMAALLSSCANIKAPISQFNKYEIKNIGFTKADLIFSFDVENPNDIPIGIRDIAYQLALDGSNVVTGTNEGFTLYPKEKKIVSFPVEVAYNKLIGQAMNIAKKFIMRNGNIKYKIDGELSVVDNVGFSARVPLNAEGEMKLF